MGLGQADRPDQSSYTAARGTIRGMHFQFAPKAEKKIIFCLKGAVCDVAVDLRRGSRAFLRHHMETLTADNGRALLIPEGCGHGFQTLTDNVELIYFHSEYYAPDHEGGVSALDPMLAIPGQSRQGSCRNATGAIRCSRPVMKDFAFEMSPLRLAARGAISRPGRCAALQRLFDR
jgi:dTDP-4-dehydrorhamnose 3,5-epimerase-like enzyme